MTAAIVLIVSMIGVLGFGLTVGFVLGVGWGTKLYEAIEARKAVPTDEKLEPQFWSPERMARVAGVASTKGKHVDYPQSYQPPGLDG